MARYKDYSYEQGKLIPITFREQIIPGSFEFALSEIGITYWTFRFLMSGFPTMRPAHPRTIHASCTAAT
jgi:hypothetical protein